MRIVRRSRPRPQIDMTPMIDCVFQLLIFFMLSSSFQSPMVQMKLPSASTKDEPPPADILVTVDAQGDFYLNRVRVTAESLEEQLRPLVAQSTQRIVSFRGDEKMAYQHFVKVVDAARRAGAVHINIVHQGVPR